MKASLVTIYTEAENKFVSRLVEESSTYGEVWIGLVKSTTKDDGRKNQQQKRSPSVLQIPTFVWIDGSKVSYEHWMLNRPLPGKIFSSKFKGRFSDNVLNVHTLIEKPWFLNNLRRFVRILF